MFQSQQAPHAVCVAFNLCQSGLQSQCADRYSGSSHVKTEDSCGLQMIHIGGTIKL